MCVPTFCVDVLIRFVVFLVFLIIRVELASAGFPSQTPRHPSSTRDRAPIIETKKTNADCIALVTCNTCSAQVFGIINIICGLFAFIPDPRTGAVNWPGGILCLAMGIPAPLGVDDGTAYDAVFSTPVPPVYWMRLGT